MSKGAGVPQKDSPPLLQWPPLPPAAPLSRKPRGSAGERAAQLEAKAREASRKLLQAARMKAEEIQTDAYREGYEEGFAAGQAEAARQMEEQLRQALTQLQQMARQMVADRHDLLTAVSGGVLELAAALSRKILAAEIDDDPRRLLPMLRQAREKLRPAAGETVKVYCHPEDLEQLAQADEVGLWPGLGFVADGGLARGDLILESHRGRLDLRLEAQLQRLLGIIQSASDDNNFSEGGGSDG